MVFTDLFGSYFAAEEPVAEEEIPLEDLHLAEKLFFGIIIFTWVIYAWEAFLSIRQRKVYKANATLPKELIGVLDQTTFEKARLYEWEKCSFSIFKDVFSQALTTALLLTGMLPYVWNVSGDWFRRALVAMELDPVPYLSVEDPDDFEVDYDDDGSFSGHFNIHGEIVQSVICICVMAVFNKVIDLPFSVYKTFVVEQRHGFNRQTPCFFIKDKIKGFFVDQILTIPITVGVLYIIHAGGDLFFVYLWGFCCVVSLFLMAIYPSVIAPLFDKYTALPEGQLRTEIEALAARVRFPLKKLYVVEGSKRSAHSNAYFYGFFNNKRIVLYDTLIADYTPLNKEKKKSLAEENGKVADGVGSEGNPDATKTEAEKREKEKKLEEENQGGGDEETESTSVDSDESVTKSSKGCQNFEVVAILGHELGHWKKNHILFHVVFGQLNLFLMFALFAVLYCQPLFYYAFGFMEEMPLLIGLIIILQFVFMPYHALLGFIMTVVSRKFEFQADRFAAELGHATGLRSGLVKLNLDNLGFPIYDWLYSAWHHSHPTLLQRLAALKKYD